VTSGQALEAFLSKLSNVKKAKGGYKASCPLSGHAHGDKDPSLSISVGDSGEIVAYCFSQHEKCYEEVLDAVGLTKADMRVNKTDTSFEVPGPASKKEPKWVQKVTGHERIHPYLEADGTKSHAIGISRRSSGKSIGIPYTMDTSGRGGALVYWEGDPYLYNLDQVTTSNGQTAYIPEGEQDCDTLTAIGKLATTNPFGASSCPNVDYSPLEGKDNVVLFDNDPAGRVRAQKVANALHPISGSVKVVELPGLSEGGDITDWIEAGHTVDEFDALVNTTPIWQPSNEPIIDGSDEFDSIDSIQPLDFTTLDDAIPEDEFLIEPIIAYGRRTKIHAKAGDGKSLLALYLAACLATGRTCLRRPASEPVEVVYLDREMIPADIQSRLESMGFDYTNDKLLQANLRYYLHQDVDPLNTKEGANQVLALVKRDRAVFVVIDTITSHTEGNENDAEPYRQMANLLTSKLVILNVSSLTLDHVGKKEEAGGRGSSAKRDAFDVIWHLTTKDDTYILKKDKGRMSGVAQSVHLTKRTDGDLRFTIPMLQISKPAIRLINALEALEVPIEFGRRKIIPLLKKAEITYSSVDLGDAIKWRKRNPGAAAKDVGHVDGHVETGTLGHVERTRGNENAGNVDSTKAGHVR
jgi:hypothetical protein